MKRNNNVTGAGFPDKPKRFGRGVMAVAVILFFMFQGLLPGQEHEDKAGKPVVYILLYPQCVLSEITKTCMELGRDNRIMTVSLDAPAPVETMDGLIVLPHKRLEAADVDSMSCLVIPGGYPDRIFGHPRWEEVKNLLQKLDKKGVSIGGICGGVFPLAASGILDGKAFTGDKRDFTGYEFLLKKAVYKQADVVVSGNIITAGSNSDVELAIELGKKLGIYRSDEVVERQVDYYKNKNPLIIRE